MKRTRTEPRQVLSYADRKYLKIETSYRDSIYIFFTMLEQDFSSIEQTNVTVIIVSTNRPFSLTIRLL